MNKISLPTLLLSFAPVFAVAADEPYRPLYHFTPAQNWMNDPNGMVWHAGEWHLFYQYNPFGDKWGHMSWGHAVSRDLLTWEHLPLALAEEDGIMIFSGSAVVDEKNTSGFGQEGKPPLVAIYTGHREGHQDQRLAYSNDRGRTWTKFPGNPVLDVKMADFRDPKVFWHEATSRWVMTVALSTEHKVHFYSSPDLKAWKYAGEFGAAGATGGLWECPDLFPLAVEGGTKWVLIVNINPGGPSGGSAGQYFIGDFDGKIFKPQGPGGPSGGSRALWLDYGADFYAGVTWSGGPPVDNRRILLGWMSNWQYANDVPTSPWRSAMSMPRELTIRKTGSGYRLAQQPVREMATLAGTAKTFTGGSTEQANAWLTKEQISGDKFDLTVSLAFAADKTAALDVLTDGTTATKITANAATGKLSVDRTHSGNTGFHPDFSRIASAPLVIPPGNEITLRILIDACSVEVFTADGLTTLTTLVLPPPGARNIHVTSAGNVKSLTARSLGPAAR